MWTLPDTLTLETAMRYVDTCPPCVNSGVRDTVIADASAIREFDSSALAVLLECRRRVLATGKNFAVRNLPSRLQQLAGLYGVSELLPSA